MLVRLSVCLNHIKGTIIIVIIMKKSRDKLKLKSNAQKSWNSHLISETRLKCIISCYSSGGCFVLITSHSIIVMKFVHKYTETFLYTKTFFIDRRRSLHVHALNYCVTVSGREIVTHKPYLPLLPLLTALRLVLIAPTHEGMARLSWFGWLVTYRDKCPAPGIKPGHGHPLSTNRARRMLTSATGHREA